MAKEILITACEEGSGRLRRRGEKLTEAIRAAVHGVSGTGESEHTEFDIDKDEGEDLGAMHTGFEILGVGAEAIRAGTKAVRGRISKALDAVPIYKPEGWRNRRFDC